MPPKPSAARIARPIDRYRPGKQVERDTSESESEYEEESIEQAPEPSTEQAKSVNDQEKADKGKGYDALSRIDLESRFGAREEQNKSEDEGSSSYESESEEEESESEEAVEEEPRRVLLKPTFIAKGKRNGNADGETDTKAKEQEARRAMTQAMLEESMQRDQVKDVEDEEEDDIDDRDGLDPEAEREEWKLRELTRLKRDREKIAKAEAEREEIEARRKMDPEQRDREDRERAQLLKESKPKNTSKFLQKYYHKGAFYQDDEILQRNYMEATENEAIDKSLLPKPMQVRGDKYGRMGQTRWTHLANEDTSRRDAGWNQVNPNIAKRLGGFKDEDSQAKRARPS